MAKAHGKDGSVTITNLTVAVDGFDFNYNDDLQDVTDFADAGVSAFMLGVLEGNATLRSFWDPTNTAKPGDAAATLTLTLDTAKTIAGSALMRSMSISADKGSVIRRQYEYQYTGAITITN